MPEERQPTREYIAWHDEYPPAGTILPPPFPKHPDLFQEVEWGPYPKTEDIKLAYRLWSLPDEELGKELEKYPHPFPPDPNKMDKHWKDRAILGGNVYEHLMREHRMPRADDEWEPDAQMKLAADGQTKEGWSYEDIFGPQDPGQENTPPSSSSDTSGGVVLQGHNVLKDRFWTVVRLKRELARRGLATAGKSAELRQRLHDNEVQAQRRANAANRTQDIVAGFFPRTDLSAWGISRHNDYLLKISRNERLLPLDLYTWAIVLSPYNPTYWVSRSYLYYQMGYFDLALGDAYRAKRLCEVLTDSFVRNRQPGLYARIWHSIEQHILVRLDGRKDDPAVMLMRNSNGINYFVPTLRRAYHNIISLSLKALQCWNDYYHMERYLTKRVQMAARDKWAFEKRWDLTAAMVDVKNARQCRDYSLFYYETKAGSVSGRPYPHSAQDVDRTAVSFLERLNHEFIDKSQTPVKRIEVRAQQNEELAVYATEPISRGQIIFANEPAIRGHLNVDALQDIYYNRPTPPVRCETCKSNDPQPAVNVDRHKKAEIESGGHYNRCVCTIPTPGTEPIVFCRGHDGRPSCLQIAREQFHFRACGRNWRWLHDAMRPGWNEYKRPVDTGPSMITHNNETHCTVLSLILREVFDVTLERRRQTGNPHLMAHEIDELLPLQGEREWANSRFPFTWAANIQVPFDILLSLGVDIFRDLTFDTWVIQMVLRKLLVSVVPWDEDPPGEEPKMRWDSKKFDMREPVDYQRAPQVDNRPTIRDIYLFPGLAMFNHTCQQEGNASWAYDKTIPNRVIVWAKEDIQAGEEITLSYLRDGMNKAMATRILGRPCECKRCQSQPTDDNRLQPQDGRRPLPDDADGPEHQPNKRQRTWT